MAEFGAEAKLTGVAEFVGGLEKIEKALKDVEKSAGSIDLSKAEKSISGTAKAAKSSGGDFDKFGADVDSAGKKASGASGDFKKAGDAADDSGKKAQSGGSSWKSYAAGTAAVTAGAAALGGGLTLAVGNAMAFEKQIDAVGAVSGASDEQLKAMGATALRIGEDTAFGAQEMGAAMEELAAQGVSADDIINGVADATAALAAAGGTDLVTAATAASTAMGVWGLETSEMNEVVNRLTGAANVSAFGIEDMLQGMASGGIAAKTFGISMEDTTTALAALSKGGFQSGSDAGTSFKAMLTGMAAPVGAGANAIEELGLSFRQANGEMKPMPDLIKELHSKLDGLGAEDRDEAMARIFGTDGMRAASVMMGMTAEEFEAMSSTMENTDAAAIAAKRMDNLSGDLDNLGGAIETVSIKFGQKLLPALRQVTQFAANAIPVAFDAIGSAIGKVIGFFDDFGTAIKIVKAMMGSDTMGIDSLRAAMESIPAWMIPVAEAFLSVKDAVQPVIDVFMQAMDNGMAMQAALGAVAGVFVLLGVAAGAAAVSIMVALAPIIAITAAAALLGAGIVLLVKHWDEIVQKFPIAGEALNYVKDAWQSVIDWVQATFIPGISGIADALQEAGERALGFAQDHWTEIQTVITGVLTYILTQVENIFTLVGEVISGAMQIVTGIINTAMGLLSGDWDKAWEGIKQIASGIWTVLSALIQYQIDTIKNIITNLGPAVVAILSMAWDLLKNITQAAWDGIKAAVSAAANAIPGLLSAAGGAIKSAASAVWDAVKSAASSAWDAIKSAVSSAISAIPGLISTAGGAIKSAASSVWDAVKSAASSAWDAIKSAVSAAISAIPGLISAGAGALKSAAITAWNGIKDGAESVWETVKGWVATLPGIAAGLITGGAGLLLEAGTAIFNRWWDGMKNIWETATGWVTSLPGLAGDLIIGGAGLLLAAGTEIMNKFWDGIKEVWENITGWFSGIPGKIVSSVGDLGGVLRGAGTQIMDGLLGGITSKFDDVKGKLDELTGMLPDWKGPAERDAVILFDSGKKIMGGLIDGIESKIPHVKDVLLGITDEIYSTTASGLDLTAAKVGDWPEIFADVFVNGIEQINPRIQGAIMEVVGNMDEEWTSGADGFGRDMGSDIDMWGDIMVEGLQRNKKLSKAEIDAMMLMIGDSIATHSGDWSLEMSRAVDEMYVGLMESLNAGEGLANAKVIEIIDSIKKASIESADGMSAAFDEAGKSTVGLREDLTSMFQIMQDEKLTVDSLADGVHDSLVRMGYDMDQVKDNWAYVMDAIGHSTLMAERGVITWEQAVEGAIYSVEEIMNGSQRTAEEWAEAFSKNPKAAAEEWNKLHDSVRYALGEILAEMGGFNEAAGALAEDFSIYVDEIPSTFEWVSSESQRIIGEMMAGMAVEMRHGGKLSTDEIKNLTDTITSLIEDSPMTDVAKAKALELLAGIATMLEQNKGTVTYQVQDMLGRILALLTDPTLVSAATDIAAEIVGALKGGLIDSPDGLARLGTLMATLLQTGIEGLKDPSGAEARDLARTIASELMDELRASGATGDLAYIEGLLTQIITDALIAMGESGELAGDEAGKKIIAAIIAALSGGAAEVEAATTGMIYSIKVPGVTVGTQTGTYIGTAVGSGVQGGIGSWGQNYAGWVNLYTAGLPAKTEPTNTAAGKTMGYSVGIGVASGITNSQPEVMRSAQSMGKISGDAAITAAIAAIEEGTPAFNRTMAGITASMETIADTAGSEAGAAYANKWHASLTAGLEAGLVSAESYAKIMMGVINSVNDPFSLANAEDSPDGGPKGGGPGAPGPKTSDSFLWRGQTGNNPETNFGALLGLAPGHHTINGINGESGFLAGSRGGQQGIAGNAGRVIISGDPNQVVANGWKWDGSKIVKMDDMESAQRWQSGWNSPFDPNTVVQNLKEGIQKILSDGVADPGEIKKLLANQNTKVAGVLSGDQLKTADDWMKMLFAAQKGDVNSVEKFASANSGGNSSREMWQGIIAAMREALNPTVPEPDPVPDSVNELPDIMRDGLIDMSDVLAARTAGFPELATGLLHMLAGVNDMTDVLNARQLGLDALANEMLNIMAGINSWWLGPEQPTNPDTWNNIPQPTALQTSQIPTSSFSGGGVTIPIDLSGGTWSSSPRTNAAMIQQAVDNAFERQRSGLVNSGYRG